MKLSNSFFITRRELPKDESTISSKLLVKSGMIMKLESGAYTYLPLGFIVINNIKKIIQKELNNINAHELLMPSLVSSEIFEKTNRDHILVDEIFNIKSRNNKLYSLCPTSEELFTYLAKYKINSYKDLHFTLYQISNKYRDENKNEFGLIRKNEFIMADAYSFDANEAGCDISYDKVYQDEFDENPDYYTTPKNTKAIKITTLLVFDFMVGIPAGSITVTHGVCSCTLILAISSCWAN